MAFALAGYGILIGKLCDLILPVSYRDSDASGPLIRCSECKRRATVLDTVPFAEAVSLGRCRVCDARVPIRWLLLPLGTSIFGATYYLKFDSVDQALIATSFTAILLALVFTDLERGVLPDRIVLPSIVAAAALGWELPGGSLIGSGYGAIAALIIAAVMVVGSIPFGRGAFGMGDVKLILLLGVLLGARDVVIAVLLGFMASGVVAIALLATRRMARGSFLPLGPFLAIGGITTMLLGDEIWDRWVG